MRMWGEVCGDGRKHRFLVRYVYFFSGEGKKLVVCQFILQGLPQLPPAASNQNSHGGDYTLSR